MPKPPETFCKALIRARADLPIKKERVYSRSWKRGIKLCGGCVSTILPSSTILPLLIRMVALTAMTRRVEDMVGQIIR